METDDNKILSAIKSELDANLDQIDRSVLMSLRHNRREALTRSAERRPIAPRMAPAFAFVTSALVFVLLLRAPGYSSLELDPDTVLSEIEFVESEIELVDELEFFRWLDATGHAG